jgi:hypothetical protein
MPFIPANAASSTFVAAIHGVRRAVANVLSLEDPGLERRHGHRGHPGLASEVFNVLSASAELAADRDALTASIAGFLADADDLTVVIVSRSCALAAAYIFGRHGQSHAAVGNRRRPIAVEGDFRLLLNTDAQIVAAKVNLSTGLAEGGLPGQPGDPALAVVSLNAIILRACSLWAAEMCRAAGHSTHPSYWIATLPGLIAADPAYLAHLASYGENLTVP